MKTKCIYKIINLINKKVYIGQSVDCKQRWRQHKKEVTKDNPPMIINRAMKKHGIENFIFEIMTSILPVNDEQEYCKIADELESNFIKEYQSHISLGKGYNVSGGGSTSPKAENFKQIMRNWHTSLSDEEKEKRSKMHSEAILKLIATKGHPAQGTKRTPEQLQTLSLARKNNPVIYTEEIRQNMSEAHIGIKDSKETKQKKSESAKEAWEKRVDYSRKCQAPNCTIEGKVKYKIIDGIRYCNKHGLRMLRYGRLDTVK